MEIRRIYVDSDDWKVLWDDCMGDVYKCKLEV
jgi:hypothetical protein